MQTFSLLRNAKNQTSNIIRDVLFEKIKLIEKIHYQNSSI